MITALILFIVAASMLAAVALTRQWAMERRGIDLDFDSMEAKDFERFSSKQKMTLGLLLLPGLLFLVFVVVYVLAGVVVTAVGAPLASL